MAGVRLGARLCLVFGIVTLVIGLIRLLDLLGRANRLGLAELASSLAPILALAIGPFFLWGLLTGLGEIYAQGERILTALEGDRSASSPRPTALVVENLPTREAPSPPRARATSPGAATANGSAVSVVGATSPAEELIVAQFATVFGGDARPANPLRTLETDVTATRLGTFRDWIRVRLASGEVGFVHQDDVRASG